MEKYSFRLVLEGAERGGYFGLKRVISVYLNKKYQGYHVKLESDSLLIENIGKEGKTKLEIKNEFESIISKYIMKWKNKSFSLEEIAEETSKKALLTNSHQSLVDSLKETISQLNKELETYKSNEKQFYEYIFSLENQLQDQNKHIQELENAREDLEKRLETYEKEDRRYIKEVDEKVKNLEKELQRAKLFIERVKRGAEHYFEEKEKQKLTQLDHLKKSLEEGNTNKHQILDYFRRNQISITENSLTTLLSNAFKNKEIRRLKRGEYSL